MRIDFDLNATPEYSSGSALLPPGKYLVAITREQDGKTRNGKGRTLRLTYDVLDGEYKGQSFGENINYQNENPTTVSIARSQLKSIGLACGKPQYVDTMDLHHIPFYVETIQDERDDGKKYTVVKSYESRSPQQQAQAYPPPQTPQPQAYAAPQYPPQPAQNYAPPQQPQQYQQPPQAAATDAPFWGN